MALKADASKAFSGSALRSTNTGITIVATPFPSPLRMARPTACTMSICECFGSMNATPSRVGISTPSPRQRALHRTPRSPCSTCRRRSSWTARSPLGIAPETASAQTVPDGRSLLGIHSITEGKVRANRFAAATRPWKLNRRSMSKRRIAFATPICAARLRASVVLMPSGATKRPRSA